MEGVISSLRASAEKDVNLKEVTAALEMHAQQRGIAWMKTPRVYFACVISKALQLNKIMIITMIWWNSAIELRYLINLNPNLPLTEAVLLFYLYYAT